jgi:hypothetical protein
MFALPSVPPLVVVWQLYVVLSCYGLLVILKSRAIHIQNEMIAQEDVVKSEHVYNVGSSSGRLSYEISSACIFL